MSEQNKVESEQEKYKIVILGGGAVGKTSLTLQFVKDLFQNTYDPTIEDSYIKKVTVDEKLVVLDIIDTAGQENYSALRPMYVREGIGFVVVYSITDTTSYYEAKQMIDLIKEVKECDLIPLVIVANKSDLEEERVVNKEDGPKLAKEQESPYCKFYECSAKKRLNVDNVFHDVIRIIRKYFTDDEDIEVKPEIKIEEKKIENVPKKKKIKKGFFASISNSGTEKEDLLYIDNVLNNKK